MQVTVVVERAFVEQLFALLGAQLEGGGRARGLGGSQARAVVMQRGLLAVGARGVFMPKPGAVLAWLASPQACTARAGRAAWGVPRFANRALGP